MIRGQQKYIDRSSKPLITAIGIRFLEASNDNVQVVASVSFNIGTQGQVLIYIVLRMRVSHCRSRLLIAHPCSL